jgi:hypothetical protein
MTAINKVMLRNGFGVDIESVNDLPLWAWFDGADPYTEHPDIGVFEGFVINLPFIKILVGKLV